MYIYNELFLQYDNDLVLVLNFKKLIYDYYKVLL